MWIVDGLTRAVGAENTVSTIPFASVYTARTRSARPLLRMGGVNVVPVAGRSATPSIYHDVAEVAVDALCLPVVGHRTGDLAGRIGQGHVVGIDDAIRGDINSWFSVG